MVSSARVKGRKEERKKGRKEKEKREKERKKERERKREWKVTTCKGNGKVIPLQARCGPEGG